MINLDQYQYKEAMRPYTADSLLERLRKIKHVALDMDGTIYKGATLFSFTKEFLNTLKEMGIGYSFLTNNPSKSTSDYIHHLDEMGIVASKEEMYTSAQATIGYIKSHHPEAKRLFLLGTPSMISEFEGAGFVSTKDSPDDVPDMIVASFDMSLTYSRLCRASWWVSQNVPYIATNPDKICPTDQPTVLVDCGSICSCIADATGKHPEVIVGKPSPSMLYGILMKDNLQPEEVAMLGDRLYTDVKMALDAKAFGVLVLTGEATVADAMESDDKPDLIADNLMSFLELLRKSKGL